MQILRTTRTGQFIVHSGREAAVMRPMFLSGAKNSGSREVSSVHITTIIKDDVNLELTGCQSHEVRRDSDSPHH